MRDSTIEVSPQNNDQMIQTASKFLNEISQSTSSLDGKTQETHRKLPDDLPPISIAPGTPNPVLAPLVDPEGHLPTAPPAWRRGLPAPQPLPDNES